MRYVSELLPNLLFPRFRFGQFLPPLPSPLISAGLVVVSSFLFFLDRIIPTRKTLLDTLYIFYYVQNSNSVTTTHAPTHTRTHSHTYASTFFLTVIHLTKRTICITFLLPVLLFITPIVTFWVCRNDYLFSLWVYLMLVMFSRLCGETENGD